MNVFSTPSVIFKVGQLDEPNGILHKVVVAQIGKVKSYFEEIDSVTLSQIEKLGNEKENGVKARFGHPNMCTSSFGTYIGRFRDFQVQDDSVLADLHLDEVCKSSPSGNLYDYIMTMAKKNPDMFGASIAFVPADPAIGEGEYPFTRVQDLLAADLVDDPAATKSLFAVDSFSYQATRFLDENPAIPWLIAKKPETIIEFMLKYFSNNNTMKKELFQKLKNLFNPAPKGMNDETVSTYNQTVEQLETDYKQQISTLESDHQKQLATLQDQIVTLQGQLSAKPTTVEGIDPQLKVSHSEETFGKQLLNDMPSHLKDKIKKPLPFNNCQSEM